MDYVEHVSHVAKGFREITPERVVQLEKELIQKARVVAAKRGTSISGLLAQELERIVGKDEAYEAARRSALAFVDKGFHLRGKKVSRDELHER